MRQNLKDAEAVIAVMVIRQAPDFDAVMEKVTLWRNRLWDNLYPIVYMDYIVIKVHQGKGYLKSNRTYRNFLKVPINKRR